MNRTDFTYLKCGGLGKKQSYQVTHPLNLK